MGTPQLTSHPLAPEQYFGASISSLLEGIKISPGGMLPMGMQAQQQQMNQYANNMYYGGNNVIENAWTTATATTGYDTTITATGDVHVNGLVYADGFQNWAQKAQGKIMRFFRVNEEVTMSEGGELTDPLDALRLKVQRWLKNPEV